MKPRFSKNKSASVYWNFEIIFVFGNQNLNKQKHFYFLKNMISLRARFEATGRLQFLPFCGDPPGTLALLKHNKVFFKEFQGHFWFCRSASRVGILFFWPGTLGDPPGPSTRRPLLGGDFPKSQYFKNTLSRVCLNDEVSKTLLYSSLQAENTAIFNKFALLLAPYTLIIGLKVRRKIALIVEW